ncbi:MAG: hypothetical protein Q7T84_16890, partial [Phenylobacterium sp.]|uniref:hypothetical protein n=1 Tax=Phenylobacterium sp. TaxID=1871053 RepID=UPI00271F4FE3
PPAPPPPIQAPPAALAPLPPPPLSRTELIAAANEAAGAYADRSSDKTQVKDALIGRRFSLKIPFGCDGAQVSPSGAQAFAEYDATKKTLRLVARPAAWKTLPLVQGLADVDQIESVEGFWVPRPWSASEACPPRRDDAIPVTPTAPTAPTLGLARLFMTGGTRALQRGERPYEFVQKIADGDVAALSRSFNLVLQGRLVGFDRSTALRCWSESTAHRPICLYAVEFDRIAFENGADGKVLAEWRE